MNSLLRMNEADDAQNRPPPPGPFFAEHSRRFQYDSLSLYQATFVLFIPSSSFGPLPILPSWSSLHDSPHLWSPYIFLSFYLQYLQRSVGATPYRGNHTPYSKWRPSHKTTTVHWLVVVYTFNPSNWEAAVGGTP